MTDAIRSLVQAIAGAALIALAAWTVGALAGIAAVGFRMIAG